MTGALFLFAQQHANTHTARVRRLHLLADGCQRMTAIKNIVQN